MAGVCPAAFHEFLGRAGPMEEEDLIPCIGEHPFMDHPDFLPPLPDPPGPPGELVVRNDHLADGDAVEIGPFQFTVSLATPRTAEMASAAAITLGREHEALRIQAAAVAAQQAGLLEEEGRLEQRATTLQLQETQLASHLQ